MRAAFALRIISGKMIFKFGTTERLRALRCPVFTGRGLYGERKIIRQIHFHGRGLHGKRQLPHLPLAQRSVLPACGGQNKSAPHFRLEMRGAA